jgi:UDP-N-acetylmuramyl pentapeptide phosphotransferase/UDP-N-acetylglucosamine-1-phosphate transferase
MMETLVIAAASAVVLVRLVLWDARRRGLLDRPNERSSHATPTPRGGGLGLLLAVGLTLILTARPLVPDTGVILAALSVGLVATIGWIDDHGGASVRIRLMVHLAAGALLLPIALRAPMPTSVLLGPSVGGLLAGAWWVFWTVSAINVVNFIDGIDGHIGLQMTVYGLFVAFLAVPSGGVRLAGLALAGASVGFLVWNWSPARIFMGDVCSGALGVLVVALGAALMAEGRVGFVAAFAPLAPIFLDAALTLVRRARRGERLSQAHRSHLYQRLANGGWGHARASLLFGVLSIASAAGASLAPAADLGLLLPLVGGLAVVWILLERVAAAAPADPPMLP